MLNRIHVVEVCDATTADQGTEARNIITPTFLKNLTIPKDT